MNFPPSRWLKDKRIRALSPEQRGGLADLLAMWPLPDVVEAAGDTELMSLARELMSEVEALSAKRRIAGMAARKMRHVEDETRHESKQPERQLKQGSVIVDMFNKEQEVSQPEERITPAPQTRPRNLMFDAVAEVCRLEPKVSGPRIAKELKLLSKLTPPATVDEISVYRRWWYEVRCAGMHHIQPPSLHCIAHNFSLMRDWVAAGCKIPKTNRNVFVDTSAGAKDWSKERVDSAL